MNAMGREIELKLTIDRADIDSLIHHPLISRCLSGPVTKKRLVSHYYDTPDQTLRGHHMALRVRWNGDAYIQTLKHKGRSRIKHKERSRNGLTDREEWEWPLEGPGLDTALVPMDFWPTALRSRLDTLVPLFETDFERTLWPLAIPAGSFSNTRIPARVEMALDQGEIRAAAGRCISVDEILEVELELLEGDSDILYSIREQLVEKIRLKPGDSSKAERGYRLLAKRS
jgi:triphosphatase